MAFIPERIESAEQTAFLYMTADAGTYVVGELLAASSGVLDTCAATAKPTYIAMQNKTLSADGPLLVTRVRPDIVYETTNSAALATATVGTMVTTASGLQCTDTATNGTFEITYIEDGAASATDKVVRGRFS